MAHRETVQPRRVGRPTHPTYLTHSTYATYLPDPPDLPDLPDPPDLPDLPAHQIHLVDVDRLFVPVEGEDDAEPHRRLRRSHRDDKDREDLTDAVLQLGGECDQVDVHRVQDQLDRHEDDDDVAAHHHADHADHEQRRGQEHVMSGS